MRGRRRDSAAFGLGVLDDAAEFEAHLRGCARCRERVAGFEPVAAALAEAARLGYLPIGGSGPRVVDVPTERRQPISGHSARATTSRYPTPVTGAARRRKPGVFSGPLGSALLVLALAAAVLGLCAARPAGGGIRFASAACIVSPAPVVAGTGRDLRDLPWPTGFQ